MPDQPAQAFLSYAHADDDFLEGGITWLRDELQRAMHVRTGKPFRIFLDKDGIDWGQHFPSRLDGALEEARFLIPILSQCYFASDYCMKEVEFFLDLERKVGRQDLILPIYLIDADVLEDPTLRKADKVAEELSQRQYADWRDYALKLRKSPVMKRSVFDLARQMKLASERVAKDATPIIPAQMIGIHFLTNRDGLIDHAKDAPSLPGADHNRLQSLCVTVVEACERAIESFSETARETTLSTLFRDLERYRALVDAPFSDIDLNEVWCRGVAVAQLVESAGKDLERSEPQASDYERQALLNTFIRQHMAFVLATPEGKALHERADRYPTSRDQRAKVFGLMEQLGEAIREDGDLVTDHVKSLLDIFCRRLDHQSLPEQHLLAVLSTCRNLLLAIAEAATGKDVHDIGDEAMGRARVAATHFLLGNEGLARQLASSGYDGLAWLDHLITWLKPSSTCDAPAIITSDFWTPGRVFRDIDEPWCPEMVVIPAGEFMMGSPEDEQGRSDDEGPQHLVTIEKPFALGRYPVTFEEYGQFCSDRPSGSPMTKSGDVSGIR
ncbi:MAG: TIR domain-containing protein [Alphaproteobacteria bacterium]